MADCPSAIIKKNFKSLYFLFEIYIILIKFLNLLDNIYMLNGDDKLNIFQKFIWLTSNFFNNIDLKIRKDSFWKNLNINSKSINFLLSKTDDLSSPSRKLCDVFWHNLPWNDLSKIFGGKIKSVEIGCGRGRYGKILEKLIDNFSYLGCDVKSYPEWKLRSNKNITFKSLNSDNVLDVINNKNFLFTQSAVEHFKNDYLFFKNIQDYVNKSSKPFLQIHLLPSSFCLWKYLMHGYRQYSTNKISKLYQSLWKKENFIAIALGGKKSNYIHLNYITIPMVLGKVDKRKKVEKKYKIESENAIKEDLKIFNPKSASFYALIIFSNLELSKNILKKF